VGAALFALGGGRSALLLHAHHLVVDMVSWRILLDDLATAYGQLERGEAAALPAKTTSYRAWAEHLEAYAGTPGARRQLAAWTRIADLPRTPLPADLPAGEDTRVADRTLTRTLGREWTRALLRDVPRRHRAQVHHALLAALGRAVAGWTGSGGVLVAVEGHGREPLFDGVDLSRTVGWFTALAPVHLDVRAAEAPGAALARVRDALDALPDRGLGHGVLRHLSRDAEVAAAIRALPEPEVTFNYLGQLDQSFSGDALLAPSGWSAGRQVSQRNGRFTGLYVSAPVLRDELRVSFGYSAARFHAETIEALAERFAGALSALVEDRATFPNANLSPEDLGRVLARGRRRSR